MRNFFDVSTPAKRFRLVAYWEAVTWAALLIAMYFKWVDGHDAAVQIPGMVHGVAGFMLFVVVALLTARSLKWSGQTTVWALLSSIPPFGTVVFEVWAARTGKLAELSAPVVADPAFAES